jgi:hypothetical protein
MRVSIEHADSNLDLVSVNHVNRGGTSGMVKPVERVAEFARSGRAGLRDASDIKLGYGATTAGAGESARVTVTRRT